MVYSFWGLTQPTSSKMVHLNDLASDSAAPTVTMKPCPCPTKRRVIAATATERERAGERVKVTENKVGGEDEDDG